MSKRALRPDSIAARVRRKQNRYFPVPGSSFHSRERIEATIALLIDLLDAIDAWTVDLEPDADAEPDDDDWCLAGDDKGTGHRFCHTDAMVPA